ncbi:ATP-binding protein [bacterium]|nr:ATP-binding protein [bacterium]
MREIVLHLLDLAENSVSAGAKAITIEVCEDLDRDLLTASIEDDGRGMDEETVKKITDPFYTSRTTRNVGLGIPLLKEAAEACEGGMSIRSKPGIGTRVEVMFRHSHIDRMPLGNLKGTFTGLTVTHPEVHWIFRYTARNNRKEGTFEFDDEPVKTILVDVPLTHPDVLTYLSETLGNGLDDTMKILSPNFEE